MNPADPRPPLVLHVVHRFAVGGLENGLVNLLNRMPPHAARHAVLALTDVDAAFRRRVTRDDVAFIALGKAPGHLVGAYPRLVRVFRERRPAIVHTRNLAALEAVVPAWAAGVPARIHGEHGRDMHDLDGTRVRYRLVRRLYRPFVSQYVALSRDLERYLVDAVGVPAARVAQLYNGVDTARFAPAPEGRRPGAGTPFRDPSLWVVGTVGRLARVKDPVLLVRAFVRALALAPHQAARMRLVIAGDGALGPVAAAAVRDARCERCVWFAGERDDVPALLRGLDAFALPSRAEGVSNTLLEAMATALPVAATRVGANADLMEEGRCGHLVPREDVDALAQALLALAADPARGRALGRAGREIVERRFSLDAMVAAYERLYRRVLARGARRAGRPAGAARDRAADG
jgi:sugar transferase (PEP-CTERM/EpsH1 system associated)